MNAVPRIPCVNRAATESRSHVVFCPDNKPSGAFTRMFYTFPQSWLGALVPRTLPARRPRRTGIQAALRRRGGRGPAWLVFFLQAPDMAAILDLMGRLPLSSQAPLLAPRVRLAFFPKQTRPKIKRLDILCDREGIDQRIIDPFVGHTTEGIEGATCTLFPPSEKAAIEAVYRPPRRRCLYINTRRALSAVGFPKILSNRAAELSPQARKSTSHAAR